MNEIDWATALSVFIFGFGGVFVCLLLLTIAIRVSGALVQALVKKGKTE